MRENTQNCIVIPFLKKIHEFNIRPPYIVRLRLYLIMKTGIQVGSTVYRRVYAEVSHMRSVKAAGLWRERYEDGVRAENMKSHSTYSSVKLVRLNLGAARDDGKGITCSLLLLLLQSFAFSSSQIWSSLPPSIPVKYRRSLPMKSIPGE